MALTQALTKPLTKVSSFVIRGKLGRIGEMGKMGGEERNKAGGSKKIIISKNGGSLRVQEDAA